MNELEVSPPHDINAEEAVIGSLIIDGVAIREIPTLQVDDFYSESARNLFQGCRELEESGTTINQITLGHALSETGKLELCGGVSYMSHLVSITPTSMDIAAYADIVQKLSSARKLIKAGEEIVRLGYKGSDIPKSLEKADDLLLSVRKVTGGTIGLISPEERVKIMSTEYDELLKGHPPGIVQTGLFDLDYHLGGGFYPGELIVLAGRTGMGKTTFLSTITSNAGKHGNVLYCTAEMDVKALTHRDIANLTGLTFREIRYGGYDSETYVKITRALLENIASSKVTHLDYAPMTTAMIHQAATSMVARKGLSLLVIDYLGLLADESKENQNIRLGSMTRKIKVMAQAVGVPVVLVHQLSRGIERREDKRPMLSDLRESGHIEEDADVVMFLYRENYYERDSTSTETELLIPKMRMGDEQNICLRIQFNKKTKTYHSTAKEKE